MSRWISFHRLAETELLDAVTHYDAVGGGLGDAFLDEVEHARGLLLAHPEVAPPVGGGIRKKGLRRFPYSLLYSIRGDEIRILAVAHHKRRPFYWKHRK